MLKCLNPVSHSEEWGFHYPNERESKTRVVVSCFLDGGCDDQDDHLRRSNRC